MTSILMALIQVAGRDAHFAGDVYNLKMIWYENIRFFDFRNYFEGRDFSYFSKYWLPKKPQNQNIQ